MWRGLLFRLLLLLLLLLLRLPLLLLLLLLLLGVAMLIDCSVFRLAQFCEKLQKYCVLQYFVGIDLLMLCKVEGQKVRETICGLIYQDDNGSVFCGLES